MASLVTIHPAVDQGLKPKAENFAGGNVAMPLHGQPGRGDDQGAMRAQSRMRLYEMLETERGIILTGCCCPA